MTPDVAQLPSLCSLSLLEDLCFMPSELQLIQKLD